MSKHSFPPHKILVPTDLGPASNVAMGFARVIHEKFGTPVGVLHACHLDVPPYFSSGQIETLKRELGKAKQSAEEQIRKENSARLGFEAGIFMVDKPPVDSILEESDRLEAGLVIMGTHGRHGARRLMLGSVAERVLRQSRIPVLVVRESARPGLFRKIFCPNRCRVEEVLVGGEAAKSILEAAQRVKPDLIVMGAEQKSTIIGELFSSTTERVMQLADAPLLVVPKY
jgi:nucleotide-binding universal stress UspA family protein